MTEVRRQKRVKVTLEKESGSNVTTFTNEWSGKSSWQGTQNSLLEHCLELLMVCIYEDSLEINVSAEHLLIKPLIGLEESTGKLTRRAYQTIRMAAVVHGISAKARKRVHGALLEALVLPEIDGEDGFGGDLLGGLGGRVNGYTLTIFDCGNTAILAAVVVVKISRLSNQEGTLVVAQDIVIDDSQSLVVSQTDI
jgi:hypothetical protein